MDEILNLARLPFPPCPPCTRRAHWRHYYSLIYITRYYWAKSKTVQCDGLTTICPEVRPRLCALTLAHPRLDFAEEAAQSEGACTLPLGTHDIRDNSFRSLATQANRAPFGALGPCRSLGGRGSRFEEGRSLDSQANGYRVALSAFVSNRATLASQPPSGPSIAPAGLEYEQGIVPLRVR